MVKNKITKKSRFINSLDALSENEKERAISFFSKYPCYESYIDWNKKDLNYYDFEMVYTMGNNSSNNIKRKAKTNPVPLFEKYNCKILSRTEEFVIAIPLDKECVAFFNSFTCGGEGSRWCIGQRDTEDWDNYKDDGIEFYFVFFMKRNLFFGKKIMVAYNIIEDDCTVWTQEDKTIDFGILAGFLCSNYIISNKEEDENQLFLDFEPITLHQKKADVFLLSLIQKAYEYVEKEKEEMFLYYWINNE
jgi:hypothetical protein